MLMIRRAVSLLLALGALSCAGPGASGPDAADVEKQIEQRIQSSSEDRIVSSDYKKIDALLQQDGSYLVDFKTTLTFKDCLSWKPGGVEKYRKPRFRSMGFVVGQHRGMYCPEPGKRREYAAGGVPGLTVGTGLTGTWDGQALFLKKESGWKLEDAWVLIDEEWALNPPPYKATPRTPEDGPRR